jgi:hypothetical protein
MQNALSASAGRAFFYACSAVLNLYGCVAWAVNCNLEVIFLGYVVVAGQLSTGLMKIVN